MLKKKLKLGFKLGRLLMKMAFDGDGCVVWIPSP
jgi:hypothetical protein